jgi:predicted MFS family arabinose efflux permease
MGLSYGPLTPASSHVIRDLRGSAALAFIVSVRQTSVPLGGVLAGLIVPPLVLANGWEATCVVLGLCAASAGAVTGLGMPLIRRETTRGARTESSSSVFGAIRFVWHRPRVLALSGMSLVFGAMQLILSSFLVIYLTAAAHLDLVTAGALLGVSQVAGVLGRLAWGFLADRVRPRRVLAVIGILIAFASALAGLFSPNWPIAWITAVVILFGATASGWNGVFLAEIMREVEPGQVSLVTGGSLVFTYFGVLVGPPLFAAMATLFGFDDAFMVVAAIVFVGSAFTLRDDLLACRRGERG